MPIQMPYNYNNNQPKTPQQLQAELIGMLQNQYAPMYNSFQQQNMQSPIQNKPSTSGIYDQVSSYQDVENYPTPTDGTAVLLFNFGNGVFYSKKFVNGQSTIQPFTFMPLNSNGTDDSTTTQETAQKQAEMPEYVRLLMDRMDKIEMAVSKSKNGTRRTGVKDEL